MVYILGGVYQDMVRRHIYPGSREDTHTRRYTLPMYHPGYIPPVYHPRYIPPVYTLGYTHPMYTLVIYPGMRRIELSPLSKYGNEAQRALPFSLV